VVIAVVIIHRYAVDPVVGSHAQVAVGSVVTVWLTILFTAEPPARTIRCAPGLLTSNSRVHSMFFASTTTICGISDINNEVRSIQWLGGCKESLPIISAGW